MEVKWIWIASLRQNHLIGRVGSLLIEIFVKSSLGRRRALYLRTHTEACLGMRNMLKISKKNLKHAMTIFSGTIPSRRRAIKAYLSVRLDKTPPRAVVATKESNRLVQNQWQQIYRPFLPSSSISSTSSIPNLLHSTTRAIEEPRPTSLPELRRRMRRWWSCTIYIVMRKKHMLSSIQFRAQNNPLPHDTRLHRIRRKLIWMLRTAIKGHHWLNTPATNWQIMKYWETI